RLLEVPGAPGLRRVAPAGPASQGERDDPAGCRQQMGSDLPVDAAAEERAIVESIRKVARTAGVKFTRVGGCRRESTPEAWPTAPSAEAKAARLTADRLLRDSRPFSGRLGVALSLT